MRFLICEWQILCTIHSIQGLDDCCYIYGSVPRNDTNCVPEGEQLFLHYTIYNPHENFTNMTVTWYRSTTKDRSTYEILPTSSEFYHYATHHSSISIQETNCSLSLYRDVYGIVINNFTSEKNGYYWCQLAVNNTFVQPSHRSWFYAGLSNSTACSHNYPYFRVVRSNEVQCAQYVINTFSTMIPTFESTSKSSWTTLAISESSLLIYILGSFSALLLITLLGVLVLAFMLVFYVHHLNKTSKLYW